MTTSVKWGAIFDWDGVVIDSGPHHEESWNRLAQIEKRSLPEGHFKKGFGMKNNKIIPEILQWTSDPVEVNRLSLRKEELYREIVKEKGIDALPGVRTWLERLQAADIPCIIGSSTHRKNIEMILEIAKLKPFFFEIISAENVSHGKPHPEVFLVAAAKINRAPEKCVVFEDAQVGIQAARAGGMKVIGVTTTHEHSHLKDTDLEVKRLDELQVSQIAKWF